MTNFFNSFIFSALFTQTGGTLYYAGYSASIMNYITQSRILVYKTTDTLALQTYSCANLSTNGFADMNSNPTTISTTSTTPMFSAVSETQTSYLPLVTPLSLVKMAYNPYTLRDYNAD